MMDYEAYINVLHGAAGIVCGGFLVYLFLKNL